MLQTVLKGIAQTVGAVAALLFLLGGRAMHEFLNVDRFLAEVEADTLALVAFLIAVLVKGAADRVQDPGGNEPISLALTNRQDTPETKNRR